MNRLETITNARVIVRAAVGAEPAVLFSDLSAGKMPAAPWGLWKALFRFFECIGTMNWSVGRHLFGVPPSGGSDRLKPGLRTGGSWGWIGSISEITIRNS